MQFSPDGLWFWDGAQWRPAYSPDGRWRWDGRQWVPVGPPAWRYEPTEWTRRLQVIVLALTALGWLFSMALIPVFLPQMQHFMDVSIANQPTSPDLDPAQLRQTTYAVMWSTLVGAGVFAVIAGVVTVIGVLRLWRWVYWYLAVSYLLALVSIPQYVLYALGYGTLHVPAWWLAVVLPLGLAQAALGAWMIVLYRRYGTWARRRVPAG